MIFIRYFKKNELENILKNHRNHHNLEIIETLHFQKRCRKRKYCEFEMVYKLLDNEVPIISDKTINDDEYKLIYNHPINKKYNIIVIIAIENILKIRLITVHPKRRRKRYEQ